MPDETTPETNPNTGSAEPSAPAIDPVPTTPAATPVAPEPTLPEANPAWFSSEARDASLERWGTRVRKTD
jgi:hypothetical protein